MKSDVLVIVLVHNEARYLEQTIRSLLSQTYNNFDVVISCNACTDDSFEIAKKFSTKDQKLIVFETPKKLSSFDHYKWVLSRIESKESYKFGINIGGHDIVSTNYISFLVGELRANSGCSLCYAGDAFAIDELDRIKFKYPPMPQTFKGGDFFQTIPLILSLRYNVIAFGVCRAVDFFQSDFRLCYAADHIRAGEISRRGIVKAVPGAQILVRDTSAGLQTYARKHFGVDQLDLRHGLADQLSWVDSISRSLLPTGVSELNDALRLAALTMYFVRYLEQFGGNVNEVNKLFKDSDFASAIVGQSKLMKNLEKWFVENSGAGYSPDPIHDDARNDSASERT